MLSAGLVFPTENSSTSGRNAERRSRPCSAAPPSMSMGASSNFQRRTPTTHSPNRQAAWGAGAVPTAPKLSPRLSRHEHLRVGRPEYDIHPAARPQRPSRPSTANPVVRGAATGCGHCGQVAPPESSSHLACYGGRDVSSAGAGVAHGVKQIATNKARLYGDASGTVNLANGNCTRIAGANVTGTVSGTGNAGRGPADHAVVVDHGTSATNLRKPSGTSHGTSLGHHPAQLRKNNVAHQHVDVHSAAGTACDQTCGGMSRPMNAGLQRVSAERPASASPLISGNSGRNPHASTLVHTQHVHIDGVPTKTAANSRPGSQVPRPATVSSAREVLGDAKLVPAASAAPSQSQFCRCSQTPTSVARQSNRNMTQASTTTPYAAASRVYQSSTRKHDCGAHERISAANAGDDTVESGCLDSMQPVSTTESDHQIAHMTSQDRRQEQARDSSPGHEGVIPGLAQPSAPFQQVSDVEATHTGYHKEDDEFVRHQLLSLALRACRTGGTGVGDGAGMPVGLSELYKLGKAIGEGAFGFVRVAQQRLSRELIAVKTFEKVNPSAWDDASLRLNSRRALTLICACTRCASAIARLDVG